jgi:hypothetical protein
MQLVCDTIPASAQKYFRTPLLRLMPLPLLPPDKNLNPSLPLFRLAPMDKNPHPPLSLFRLLPPPQNKNPKRLLPLPLFHLLPLLMVDRKRQQRG